jgi:antitoxin ParD1/3/4
MFGKGKTATMAGTKAIRVKLGAQQASPLRHLESGQYDDASEVVRDALRALDQRDAPVDEVLREEVRASMADKRPSVSIDEVFKRARVRIAQKVKAASRGA